MKTNLKIFLSFLVFGLFVSSSVFALNNPPATLSSDDGITLSYADDLTETYDIDISDRNWTIDEASYAVVYLEEKSELIDLELDWANQKLVLTLDLDAAEAATWDVEKWNEHLVDVR